MDSFELNKYAGGILVALLAVFGTQLFYDIIFKKPKLEKPGYEVAAVAHDGTQEQSTKTPDSGKKVASIGELLAAADVERGKKSAKKCTACHTFKKGDKNKTGPNLYGVVGRTTAAIDGFKYSSALKAMGGEWSYEQLDCFLAKPKKCVAGTTMAFAGLKKPGERADLIKYLRSLADSPKPLP